MKLFRTPTVARPVKCQVVLAALALVAGLASATAGEFRFSAVDDKSLKLWEGDVPVLTYNHGVVGKEGVPADRARSTYIHPLYGLDGEVLTDDFPKDHYHHRGLFWAWPHVKVGEKEYDLWLLKGVEQRFERWISRESGARAVLAVQNGWYAGGRKIMDEQVNITVHPAMADSRALDLDFVWTPVAEAVTLAGAEGKSYGGLTLRFAPRSNTVITTPVGNGIKDLPMTRLAWADLTAQFPGVPQPSGAAIFVPESHPDFPPMWLTRHYGVLCLGWPGVDAQTFPPGEPIRCGYRVWIHRGSTSTDQLRAAYRDYNGRDPRQEFGKNRFFAFDNGVGRGKWSPAEQAKVLKDLGYDGISYNETVDVTNRLTAFQEQGLKLFSLYVHGFPNKPVHYEPGLTDAIRFLANTDAMIWLTIREMPGEHDAEAVKLAQEVADLAAGSGLRVALYPHKGFYVATAQHALRLVKQANRENLGLTINLCHELMAGNGGKLGQIVKESMPHLFLVSINGADPGSTVPETIKVLGEGSFDVLGFLQMLDRANYAGPIGLQCYNLPGDPRDNLRRSMVTWRRYLVERCRNAPER